MDPTSLLRDSARASPRCHRRLDRIALTVGAAVFAMMLAWNIGAYAGGADTSGYLNQARLLRDGRVHVARRTVPGVAREGLSDYVFMPLGFVPSRDDTMTPTYPIGLPLLVVATSWLAGWEVAPHLTMWLHALAGVALMFALARAFGLPAPWAAFGTLLLATSPLYLFMALHLMSDVPALVWTTAAVLFAWRSRTHGAWAAAAGAALAVAVLIRPTNLLALAPVAVALGGTRRRWLALIAAGLPGAVALAAYNHAAYGNAFVTGYGSMWSNFSGGLLPLTLAHYARWLPVELTPVVVCALGLPWLARDRRLAVIAVWILAFGGFYSFYAFTHETWWYLRFVLPAFPPLIVAALLVANQLADAAWLTRWRGHARAAAAAGGALALLWSVGWGWHLRCLSSGRDERRYFEASAWARAHLPANALLLSVQTSGALYHDTDFAIVRWDQLQPGDGAMLDHIARREGRPVVAVLFGFEEKEALRERLPGRWKKIGAVPHVAFWLRNGPGSPAP